MVDCGSLEGLGVDVFFLHCALAGEWLWDRRLGRVAAKDCVIACRRWFGSWNSIAIDAIGVAMLAL